MSSVSADQAAIELKAMGCVEVAPDILTPVEDKLLATFLPPYANLGEPKIEECQRNWAAGPRLIDVVRGVGYLGDLKIVKLDLIRDPEVIAKIAGLTEYVRKRLIAAQTAGNAFCLKATTTLDSDTKLSGDIVRHIGYMRQRPNTLKLNYEGILWERKAGDDEGDNNIQAVLADLGRRKPGSFRNGPKNQKHIRRTAPHHR